MAKFIHFTGIVEDRNDPSKVGRVRVRCLGYHSENKTALPTADLPWAQPLLPTTQSGIKGPKFFFMPQGGLVMKLLLYYSFLLGFGVQIISIIVLTIVIKLRV